MQTLPWPLGRRHLDEALSALRGGALVVYPTETVYGIGVVLSAGDAGIARVRAAKDSRRPRPYLVLVHSPEAAFALWSHVPPVARVLALAAWPGPLTLVGPARDGLPAALLSQVETDDGPVASVAVRVPGDPALRQLLGRLGEPLLSTSANVAGSPPPVRGADVDLDSLQPDLFLEAEACPGGEPSTLMDVIVDPPSILRQGAWRPTLVPEGPSSPEETA